MPAERQWRWPATPAPPPATWRARWSGGARRACAPRTTMAGPRRVMSATAPTMRSSRAGPGRTRHGLRAGAAAAAGCDRRHPRRGAGHAGAVKPLRTRDVGRRAPKACVTRAEAVRDVRDRAARVAESVVDTAKEAAQREGILIRPIAPLQPASRWRTRPGVRAMWSRRRPPPGATLSSGSWLRTTASSLATEPTRGLRSMTEAVSQAEPTGRTSSGRVTSPGPQRVRHVSPAPFRPRRGAPDGDPAPRLVAGAARSGREALSDRLSMMAASCAFYATAGAVPGHLGADLALWPGVRSSRHRAPARSGARACCRRRLRAGRAARARSGQQGRSAR